MPATFLLRVIGERASDIHRSRNFAEELHFTFIERGLGTTSDPDTMKTELQVTVSQTRMLGEAKKLMRHLIAKHLMEDDIEITRL